MKSDFLDFQDQGISGPKKQKTPKTAELCKKPFSSKNITHFFGRTFV